MLKKQRCKEEGGSNGNKETATSNGSQIAHESKVVKGEGKVKQQIEKRRRKNRGKTELVSQNQRETSSSRTPNSKMGTSGKNTYKKDLGA